MNSLCDDSNDRVLSFYNPELVVSSGWSLLKFTAKAPYGVHEGGVKELEVSSYYRGSAMHINPSVFELPCDLVHLPRVNHGGDGESRVTIYDVQYGIICHIRDEKKVYLNVLVKSSEYLSE